MGNEEMVQFDWETFSNFQNARYNDPQTEKDRELKRYMNKFKLAFCRPNVGVHFLGLFDCVNSVGQFEIPLHRKSYQYIATPAAKHIRHAVSIHERRLKFKPALSILNDENIDLKEEWFAGNHGDVGGGWDLQPGQKHLLSETPLNWMVQEILNLPGSTSTLSFQMVNVEDLVKAGNALFPCKEGPGTIAFEVRRRTDQPHDMLRFGGGAGWFAVAMWWIIGTSFIDSASLWPNCSQTVAECLPIFMRLKLEKGKWVPHHWPRNFGAPCDIPKDAKIHDCVDEMVKAGILEESSIPKKGGDNPHLQSVAPVMGRWDKRHKVANKDDRLKATSVDDSFPGLKAWEHEQAVLAKAWS